MIEFLSHPNYDKYGLSGGAWTGKFFFFGAMALDMEKLKRLDEADTVPNEIRYCLNRLEQRLQSRGLGKRDIVKISAYMTDESYRDQVFAGIKAFFDPGPYPVVFAVVAGIARGCRIEFEAIAAPGTGLEFLAPAGSEPATSLGHSSGATAHGYAFAAVNGLDSKQKRRESRAGSVADETRLCLEKLAALLAQKGLSLRNLVKVNAYLSEDGHRAEFWDAYTKALQPGPYPVRCTWVAGVAGDTRVQLDAVAAGPPRSPKYLGTNEASGVSVCVVTDHLVYASALAIDPKTMKRVPEAQSVADETRIAVKRLESRLAEAGCSLRDVAKTTCFIRDEAQRFDFVYAYKECFDPGPYPSRASYSLGLAGDCRFQVDAIAIRPTTS
jgi:2-iminobutanoate/2-iminopropanoate deaminase